MSKALGISIYVCLLLAPAASAAPGAKTFSRRAQARIVREVRHRILMLAEFGVFDNIAFKLRGYDVTLIGQVTRPSLKSDAEREVKRIEGVEKVVNRIEVLPVSFHDDRLRRDVFRAIYGYGPLQHYGVGSNRPIHIIVNRGHVTLVGVVDSQADKNLAGIRAKRRVWGVFRYEQPGGAQEEEIDRVLPRAQPA